jgi:membrane protease YdiL (CAAX protease family)
MGWTWQDIGIHSGFSFLGATCFGSLTAVPFWLVLNAVQRSLMKRDDKSPVSDLATMLYSLPRGKVAQTIATLELVIVSPILEEIVYRGFFVFLLGNLVDLANATACFGLLLFVLLHLYQGLHRIPSNVLFFSTAVGLLYSPFGLAGAIGFHIACNLRYALARPYMARQYMASRQLAKVAPALREGRQVTRIGLVPQADADAEKGISPISDK